MLRYLIVLFFFSFVSFATEPPSPGEEIPLQERLDAGIYTHCNPPRLNNNDLLGFMCAPAEELQERACRNKAATSRLKAGIANEKDIAKKSGFINAGKVQEYSEGLLGQKEELGSLGKWYKKKTGKVLSLDNCPPDSF